jgi:glycosyltransferase
MLNTAEATVCAPKITVIIAVRNTEKYIERALLSLINQTYKNVEIIVMDGLSTDNTVAIINRYRSYLDIFHSKADRGCTDAFNNAIQLATGDIIGFLNADDEYSLDLLQHVAHGYQDNPDKDVITCPVVFRNQLSQHEFSYRVTDNKLLSLTFSNMLFGQTYFNAHFFKQNIFKQYGTFKFVFPDGSFYISNDREFLMRLIFSNVQNAVISEGNYIYYLHAESMTSSKKNDIKIRNEQIYQANEMLNYKPLNKRQRQMVQRWRAQQYAYLCYYYIIDKSFNKVYATFYTGLRYVPFYFSGQLAYIPARFLCNFVTSKIRRLKTVAE